MDEGSPTWPSCLLGVAVLALSGCGLFDPEPFVDFAEFEVIPSLEQLDFSSSSPQPGILYWELRETLESPDYRIRASGGSVAREDIAPDRLAVLDTVSSDFGFAPSCLPGGCFHYIATVAEDGAVAVWNTSTAVRTLLAPVDGLAEAALIAFAADYSWSRPIETGAFRRERDAWRLVVTSLVSACLPLRVDRFLLEVDRDGGIDVLDQELYSEERDLCI